MYSSYRYCGLSMVSVGSPCTDNSSNDSVCGVELWSGFSQAGSVNISDPLDMGFPVLAKYLVFGLYSPSLDR